MRGRSFRNGFLGLSAVALLVGTGAFIRPAAATPTVIGFDNLSDNGNGTLIANGYQGLNWNNFYVLNTADFATNVGPNGATNGTTSQPNVAFDGNGDFASFTSTSGTFTLNSAEMTAFWMDNLQVTVTGLLNGTKEDQVTLTLSSTAATLESFNWSNINEVDVFPVNGTGTQNLNYSGSGNEVAIDDLTITTTQVSVPEPSTLALFAAGLAGLLGLGLIRRRRTG